MEQEEERHVEFQIERQESRACTRAPPARFVNSVIIHGIVCELWPDSRTTLHVIRNFTMQSDALIITCDTQSLRRGFMGHDYTRKRRFKFYETLRSLLGKFLTESYKI
jgi:hypothetical protein